MAPNQKRCLGFLALDDTRASTPPSGIHLVFLVDNAPTALVELHQREVPITRGITVGSWGTRHFVVTEPAGVALYISERAEPAEAQHHASPIWANTPDDRSTSI